MLSALRARLGAVHGELLAQARLCGELARGLLPRFDLGRGGGGREPRGEHALTEPRLGRADELEEGGAAEDVEIAEVALPFGAEALAARGERGEVTGDALEGVLDEARAALDVAHPGHEAHVGDDEPDEGGPGRGRERPHRRGERPREARAEREEREEEGDASSGGEGRGAPLEITGDGRELGEARSGGLLGVGLVHRVEARRAAPRPSSRARAECEDAPHEVAGSRAGAPRSMARRDEVTGGFP